MTRCLIIEGRSTDDQQLATMLEAYGFEVERAQLPEQALMLCRQRMPDFLVMPATMRSMSGALFLKSLKRARGGSPAVLVYADGESPAVIGQAIWEGAAECLFQPFDADILDFKLRQIGVIASSVAA
jgi:two-component system chemotaxis response regulator CheY